MPPFPPPVRSSGRGGVPLVAAIGGALAGSMLGIVGGNLLHVHRMRRGADGAAGSLDHESLVGSGDRAPLRLVVVGDSAARGYGLDSPASAFPQCTAQRVSSAIGRPVAVSCFATDGHTTADVIAEQLPSAVARAPDAVVVSVGVNDAVAGTSRPDLERATAALLEQLRTRVPAAVVVLVPCPDLTGAPGLPRPLNRLLGWRCRRVAAAQQRGAVGSGVAIAPLPAPDASLFGADGFHPSATAHAAMADVAAAALVDAAARRSAWISN